MEPNNKKGGNTLRNLLLVIGVPLVLFFGMWSLLGGQSASRDKKVYSEYIQYFI